MSDPICWNPNFTENWQTLSCEWPVPATPAVSPAPNSFAVLPPTPAVTASRPALWRTPVETMRWDLVYHEAFPNELATPGAPAETETWAYSPLGAMLMAVGCSNSNPGEPSASDSGSSDAGPDVGATPPAESPPHFGGSAVYSNTPCGAEGMITDLDDHVGACANYSTGQHFLFSWSPGAALTPILPLLFPPDQVLRADSGRIFMNTHDNPGLAWVDPAGGAEGHIPFPTSISLSGSSSSGRSLSSVTPRFAKGMVEIGDEIFIATSNLDLEHSDYQPGSVLAYRPSTGTFSTTPLWTSGFNPTSVAESGGLLLVVNSGALDAQGHATTPASLDVFDPVTHARLRSVDLGTTGAGVSGEIALSTDGSTLVLPTADNSGRLVVVDLNTLLVRELPLRSEGISSDRVFFTSLQVSPGGRYVWASNFNDGKIYSVDLETGHLVEGALALDTVTTDALGLSDGIRIGRDLFIGNGIQIQRIHLE